MLWAITVPPPKYFHILNHHQIRSEAWLALNQTFTFAAVLIFFYRDDSLLISAYVLKSTSIYQGEKLQDTAADRRHFLSYGIFMSDLSGHTVSFTHLSILPGGKNDVCVCLTNIKFLFMLLGQFCGRKKYFTLSNKRNVAFVNFCAMTYLFDPCFLLLLLYKIILLFSKIRLFDPCFLLIFRNQSHHDDYSIHAVYSIVQSTHHSAFHF